MFEPLPLKRTLWQSCAAHKVDAGAGDIELTTRRGLTASFVHGAFGAEAELAQVLNLGGFSGDRIAHRVDSAFTHYFSTLDAAGAIADETDFTVPEQDAAAAHRIAGVALQNVAVQIHRQTYDAGGPDGLLTAVGNAALDAQHEIAAGGLGEAHALKRQVLAGLALALKYPPLGARPALSVHAQAHMALVDALAMAIETRFAAVEARSLNDRRALQNTFAGEVSDLKRATGQLVQLKFESIKHLQNANVQDSEGRIVARVVKNIADRAASKTELDAVRAMVHTQTGVAENLRNHNLAVMRDGRSAVQALRRDLDHVTRACPEARLLRARLDDIAAETAQAKMALSSLETTIAKADRANEMAAKISDRLTAAFSALSDKVDMRHLAVFHDIETLNTAVNRLQIARADGANSTPAESE